MGLPHRKVSFTAVRKPEYRDPHGRRKRCPRCEQFLWEFLVVPIDGRAPIMIVSCPNHCDQRCPSCGGRCALRQVDVSLGTLRCRSCGWRGSCPDSVARDYESSSVGELWLWEIEDFPAVVYAQDLNLLGVATLPPCIQCDSMRLRKFVTSRARGAFVETRIVCADCGWASLELDRLDLSASMDDAICSSCCSPIRAGGLCRCS